MASRSLAEVEIALDDIDSSKGFDLIFDLLIAYGTAKSTISRLKKGSSNKAKEPNQVLLKKKVFWQYDESLSTDKLLACIDDAKHDTTIAKQNPRFIIFSNGKRLVAVDTSTHGSVDSKTIYNIAL